MVLFFHHSSPDRLCTGIWQDDDANLMRQYNVSIMNFW